MANIEEGQGFIAGRSQYNALLALKAAELAGEDPSVVRTVSDGYTVPEHVLDKVETARKEFNDDDFDESGNRKVAEDGAISSLHGQARSLNDAAEGDTTHSLHDDTYTESDTEAPDGGAGAAGVAAAEADEAGADRDTNVPTEEHPSEDEAQKKPARRSTAKSKKE